MAIDRATRWVNVRLMRDKLGRSASAVLKSLHKAAAIRIRIRLRLRTILTANLFPVALRQGVHPPTLRMEGTCAFRIPCFRSAPLEISFEHRVTPVRRLRSNGIAKRFNVRIA